MSIRFQASSNFGSVANTVAGKRLVLRQAMRAATEDATELVRASVVQTLLGKTNMSAPQAQAIVRAETGPSSGDVSRGRVSLSDPPARFYPRQANALAFTIGGRRIVVASVRGSRPHKLVGQGASGAEPAVAGIYDTHVAGAMD